MYVSSINRQRGFTLLELFIVLTIVAITLPYTMPNYRQIINEKMAEKAIAQMQAITDASRVYRDNLGVWPCVNGVQLLRDGGYLNSVGLANIYGNAYATSCAGAQFNVTSQNDPNYADYIAFSFGTAQVTNPATGEISLDVYPPGSEFAFDGLLPRDGSRPMLGDLDMGGFDINNVNTINATTINADEGNIVVVNSTDVNTENLNATNVIADNGTFTNLDTTNLTADNGDFVSLNADTLVFDTGTGRVLTVEELYADDLYSTNGVIDNLTVTNITGDNANFDVINSNQINNSGTITTDILIANNLQFDTASGNNLTLSNNLNVGGTITTTTLNADTANIQTLNTNVGNIRTVNSDTVNATTGNFDNLNFTNGVGDNLTLNDLTAVNGYIENFTFDNATGRVLTVDELNADIATVDNFNFTTATGDTVNATAVTANDIDSTNITTVNIDGDTATFTDGTIQNFTGNNADITNIISQTITSDDGVFENLTVTNQTDLNLLDVSGQADFSGDVTMQDLAVNNIDAGYIDAIRGDFSGDVLSNRAYSRIYYDSDNTSYYMNPASTSSIQRLFVNHYPSSNNDVATKSYVDTEVNRPVSYSSMPSGIHCGLSSTTSGTLSRCNGHSPASSCPSGYSRKYVDSRRDSWWTCVRV